MTSVWHRAALVVLPAGALLSLGAAFGPVWVVRAGVLAALVTAAVVLWLCRQELAEARADHAVRSDRAAADHRSARARTERVAAAAAQQAERTLAERETSIATLEHRVGELYAESVALSGRNHDLTIRLQLCEDELARLTALTAERPDGLRGEAGAAEAEPTAEVRPLPRRVLREPAQPDPGWDNLEVDVS